MDMNTMTLPRKGLKTRHHNKDMNERGLKKYDYTKYMDMEKEYLKKLSKGQLIKLLLKQKKSKKVSNHEDLLNNNPFKDEVPQEPTKRIKPPKPTRKPPPPPIPQVEDHIINMPVHKIKELNRALKGELQRQNKLISSERPFKILQNETNIINIGHAVLEIFNFKD